MKAWGVRSGIIGDIVISLPVVNYVKQKYPDCYFNFVIDKAHGYAAPLFLNHRKIDRIKITDLVGSYGPNDLSIIRECDIVFNCTPPSLPPYWWNNEGTNLVHATWVMAGLPLEEYFSLPENQRLPKLYRWWDRKPFGKKHIAIWPFAAYGKGGHRNPLQEQWETLISMLLKEGYVVHHFGWHEEPRLNGEDFNHTKQSFIEQIQMSLNCEKILCIESGATWSLAAYGEIPQLNLLCMSDHPEHQHKTNPLAYEPKGVLSTSHITRDNWRNFNIEKAFNHFQSL